jgi:hypothetical protein
MADTPYIDPATNTTYTSYDVFKQYNPTGVGGTPGTPAGADISNQAISLDKLATANPITVPPATPTVDPLAGAVAGAEQTVKSYDEYLKTVTPPETETSKEYDRLVGDLDTLLPGLTGRGAAQSKAEADAGLPEKQKQLADINARILTAVAEAKQSDTSYEKLIANLENPQNAQQQGIPMNAIIGQQAQVRKMQLAEHNAKAADLGLMQAFALGLQGQVEAAQKGVDRAIDLKYADREATVKLKLDQLKLLEGKLNKEEEAAKKALELKYNAEQTKIAEEKAEQKTNVTTALNSNIKTRFTNWNGKFYDTMTGVVYPNPPAFFKAAGVTSFEDAYAKGLVSDVTQAADYSKYPTSYQEYILAKKEGFNGTYNEYQTMDANRKAVRNTTVNNTTLVDEKRTYDLQVAQAPSQVAILKGQGKSWQQIADYFNQLGIDPGTKEIDDALHRAFQSQKDYAKWKENQ